MSTDTTDTITVLYWTGFYSYCALNRLQPRQSYINGHNFVPHYVYTGDLATVCRCEDGHSFFNCTTDDKQEQKSGFTEPPEQTPVCRTDLVVVGGSAKLLIRKLKTTTSSFQRIFQFRLHLRISPTFHHLRLGRRLQVSQSGRRGTRVGEY